MKNKLSYALTLAVILSMLVTAVALASAVDVSVVDVTAPTGSVTLAPGTSGSIVINMTVTGNQVGTATFDVFRDWTLSGGNFVGSNAQTFTVPPRAAQDPATTFSTTGTVTIADAESSEVRTLAVGAFNITNSNQPGAKLADGTDSSYQVTVPANTPPTVSVTSVTNGGSYPKGSVPTAGCSVVDAEDGNSTFAATLSAISGPYTADGIGSQTASCSYTDGGGITRSASATYSIFDGSAPDISYVLTPSIPDGDNNWYKSNVTLVWTVTESQSPSSLNKTGCVDQNITADQDATTYSCSATSAGGSAGPVSVSIKRDATPPTITYVGRTPANANGWNNGDVTVEWSCSDSGSGVVSASVAETVSSEGADQSVTGTCTDSAGNTASDTQTGINIDKTAPTASASASPAPNANGWNNSAVTVSFSGDDGLTGSGIDFCSTAVVLSVEGAGQSASGTCTDKAGNVSALATKTGINIDMTAPTASASASPAAYANGWNNTNVTVSFTGTDGLSDIDFCSAAVVLSGEGAGQSASGTCTDKAGNESASATATVSIDKTAPTVSLVGGPADGGSYYFWFVPVAPTCSATDALSGLDGSCTVSGYSAAVGSHTVTASATDKAGNSSSVSATYTVLGWTLSGFFQPVDMNGVFNLVKNGSTVPLKFRIFAGTTEITDVAAVSSLKYAPVLCNATAPVDTIETLATGGTSLRYDTTGGQFIYNWKTPTTLGCYSVTMRTVDGGNLSAFFKLK